MAQRQHYGTYTRLNLHVSADEAEVIGAALMKLTPEARAIWHNESTSTVRAVRARRKAIGDYLKDILACHADARKLFGYVQRGGK